MIAYVDTSALVKLFVTEEASEATREMLLGAWITGTGLLTHAELGAALARGARRDLISETEALNAQKQIETIWPSWVHIAVDENLVSRAESLAWEYKLRGYDAIHLASALTWQERIEHQVVLATFDRELWEAAQGACMEVWPEKLS
jgi:predicted nucleic acid-binding protein